MIPFWQLNWRAPTAPPQPLPSALNREFISTPSGPIELISACGTPSSSSLSSSTTTLAQKPSSPPILFQHGGSGSAAVWIPYITYLSSRNIPCYALSLRGHGNSWHPSFLGLVWGTGIQDYADDLRRAVEFVREREGRDPILVGHSSGGGLSQYALGKGIVKVEGLVLVAAVPCFGSAGVYQNWAKFDPFFLPRMLLHGYHPSSPLSTPFLVKRAFFSDSYPMQKVKEFMGHMSNYECLWWPMAMIRPFVKPEEVLQGLTTRSEEKGSEKVRGERVMMLAGEADRIVSLDVMEKLTAMYREGYWKLVKQRRIDKAAAVGDGGVRIDVVKNAAHHCQNDDNWEEGAEKLYQFVTKL